MIRRTLTEVAAMCGGTLKSEAGLSLAVAGVSTDTRTLTAGNLYVPLVGEHFNGHQFVEQAMAKGAAAFLWQKDHGPAPAQYPSIQVDDTLSALQKLAHAYRSQLKVKIAAITGSNGKTTTKDLTASVLATSYKVLKTAGNYNNHIGLPLTLLKLSEDTDIAVLEMGMSGRGEIELLSELAEPELVIITNIGEAHLLQLGTRTEIARAKLEIMTGLKPGGTLVYLGDEPLIASALEEWVLNQSNHEPLNFRRVSFGAQPCNDLVAEHVSLDTDGTHFQLSDNREISFYIPVLGMHNVINALAAIATGRHFQITDAVIAAGLRDCSLTGMRIEKLQAASGLTILNDAYNASPTSMRASIALLNEWEGYSRKIVVLGDMLELGPQEIDFHQQIGRLLDPQKIDRVYTIGSLARHIAEEAAKRFPTGSVTHCEDKQLLTEAILSYVEERDVVLVKGSRGMKLEQVVTSLEKAIR